MRKFLDALHRHPRRAWTGLLLYAAAVTFPHEQVQLIVGRVADLLTRPGLYRLSAAVALALGAVVTAILLRSLRAHPARRKIAAFWVVTLGLLWLTWRVFIANNTELVHYPQYFPEGVALAAITLSPTESLAWIALAGGLDEAYQYWVLYPRRVTALDFNDIYMDVVGGAAGIVFAGAFLNKRKRATQRPGMIALASVIVAGILLWSTGHIAYRQYDPHPHWFALSRQKPSPFWSLVPGAGPHFIHELTPIEGILLILATIAIYALF